MGDNTRPVLSGEEIDQLIRAGLTEQEIADQYGLSKSAVSKRRYWTAGVRRTNVYQTTAEIARGLFPWKGVGKPFNRTYPWQVLKAHSVWQVRYREDDLSPAQLRKLVGFYRRLITEGLIVEFDPTIPPGGEYQGFALRTRTESDDDLLIRANGLTDLSELPMRVHWSIPTVMPKGAEDLVFRPQHNQKDPA